MRNSFLLSSAAVLVSVTAASAADLPSKKAAPVEYVKVCKIGSDFVGFVLPGSDTCIKIGGFGRFQVDVRPTYRNKAGEVTNLSAVGSLNIDARSQTELGTLAGYARIDAGDTGAASLDSAFASLGGFKAGYFGSAYKFYDGAFGVGTAFSPAGNGSKPVQAQYAINFGAATLTLAIEDSQRRVNGGTVAPLGRFGVNGGQRVPDIVAALDATFGLATLHLGAVAHQVSTAGTAPPVVGLGTDSRWGFAVLGGVKAAFTPADTLYLEAAYTNGASSRSEDPNGGFRNLRRADTLGDYYLSTNANGTSIKLIDTYYVLAAYQHAWTSTFSTFVSGSYLKVELPKFDQGGLTRDPGGFDRVQLAVGATWTPVKNLSISPEFAYINAKADTKATAFYGFTRKSETDYTARLRVQRDF